MDNEQIGSYYFSTNFDSGNLDKVELINENEGIFQTDNILSTEYNVWTKPDCARTEYENLNRSWFFFGMHGGEPNQICKINVMNLNRQTKLFSQGMHPVMRISDNGKWERIKDKPSYNIENDNFVLSFLHRPLENNNKKIYYAFTYPFTYTELQHQLENFDNLYLRTDNDIDVIIKRIHNLNDKNKYEIAIMDLSSSSSSSTTTTDDVHNGGILTKNTINTNNPINIKIDECKTENIQEISQTSLNANIVKKNTEYEFNGDDLIKLLTKELEREIYYHRELLINSLEHRRIDLLTITSFHGIQNKREQRLQNLFPDTTTNRAFTFNDKKIIFVSSRVHPGETPASFVLNGFLKLLLDKKSVIASNLRKLYVFKIIPFLNPDGVFNGHYRTDTLGHNLNRVYLNPNLDIHPSIYAAQKLIKYYHNEEDVLKENNSNDSMFRNSEQKSVDENLENTNFDGIQSSENKNSRKCICDNGDDEEIIKNDALEINALQSPSPPPIGHDFEILQSLPIENNTINKLISQQSNKNNMNLIKSIEFNPSKSTNTTSTTISTLPIIFNEQFIPELKPIITIDNNNILTDVDVIDNLNKNKSGNTDKQSSIIIIKSMNFVENEKQQQSTSASSLSIRDNKNNCTKNNCNKKLNITKPSSATAVMMQNIKKECPKTENSFSDIDHDNNNNNNNEDVGGNNNNNIRKLFGCFHVNKRKNALSTSNLNISADFIKQHYHQSASSSNDLSQSQLRNVEKSNMFLYIDLHGHASKKGIFMYGNHLPNISEAVECMLLPKLMSINCQHFHFDACVFSERNMYHKGKRDGLSKEGSGRVAIFKTIGLIKCYTLEGNYNTGRYVNVLPPRGKSTTVKRLGLVPPKYSPTIFEEVGRALGPSILDLTNSNPISRLQNSDYHSVQGLRNSLRKEIDKTFTTSSNNIITPTATSTISKQNVVSSSPKIQRLKKIIKTKSSTSLSSSSTISIGILKENKKIRNAGGSTSVGGSSSCTWGGATSPAIIAPPLNTTNVGGGGKKIFRSTSIKMKKNSILKAKDKSTLSGNVNNLPSTTSVYCNVPITTATTIISDAVSSFTTIGPTLTSTTPTSNNSKSFSITTTNFSKKDVFSKRKKSTVLGLQQTSASPSVVVGTGLQTTHLSPLNKRIKIIKTIKKRKIIKKTQQEPNKLCTSPLEIESIVSTSTTLSQSPVNQSYLHNQQQLTKTYAQQPCCSKSYFNKQATSTSTSNNPLALTTTSLFASSSSAITSTSTSVNQQPIISAISTTTISSLSNGESTKLLHGIESDMNVSGGRVGIIDGGGHNVNSNIHSSPPLTAPNGSNYSIGDIASKNALKRNRNTICSNSDGGGVGISVSSGSGNIRLRKKKKMLKKSDGNLKLKKSRVF